MCPHPVAPSSPPPTLGRKRTKDFDLPPRMQRKGTRFYYVCNSKWLPLGADLAGAKRRWADLEAGGVASGLTVADLVLRYIERDERPASTAAQYRSYHKALADAFPIPAAQLTSKHVALWRELQRSRKTYANGCIALLVAAFRLGAELGLCERLTVGKWEIGERERVLTPAEFRAIRDQAPEWLQIAMDLGYLTSQRPCDLRGLRWDSCRDGVLLFVLRKTKARIAVTISDDVASVLERARRRPILGLYVVATAKGRPVTRNMLSYAWLAACRKAGVEDAQFRDIRAMAARAAKDDGLDYQALLGHTTRRMSERYLKGRQTTRVEPVRRKL